MLMTLERPQLSRSEREDYVMKKKKNTKIILWALGGGTFWPMDCLSLKYGVYGRSRYLTMAKGYTEQFPSFFLYSFRHPRSSTKKRRFVIFC
jgi:hypothetical protein